MDGCRDRKREGMVILMAEYLTNTADLTAVADAIRAKGDTYASLVYPSGFVSAIQAIDVASGGVTWYSPVN